MWKKIASRYANEAVIAAWDLINEPTGSGGDNLQKDMYNAVRSVDKNHILM
jgi:endoglucanase